MNTRSFTDTVLVVADGGLRTHTIVDGMLRAERNVVVTGPYARDLVPYLDAGVRDHVWAVIADPADPTQISDVIERATDRFGPVIIVIDPGGRLVDVAAADRNVA
ncbi:MAG: hypothetical protein QM662_07170 [Gordonia sp. (in: high G+C Gram-positive bacteria)]